MSGTNKKYIYLNILTVLFKNIRIKGNRSEHKKKLLWISKIIRGVVKKLLQVFAAHGEYLWKNLQPFALCELRILYYTTWNYCGCVNPATRTTEKRKVGSRKPKVLSILGQKWKVRNRIRIDLEAGSAS